MCLRVPCILQDHSADINLRPLKALGWPAVVTPDALWAVRARNARECCAYCHVSGARPEPRATNLHMNGTCVVQHALLPHNS